jgi:hypothetical protein
MASLTIACIAYLLALHELFRGPGLRADPGLRRVAMVGLVFAAVWHVAFVRLPPGVDDDIHRYLWDGRLQRLGYNPYLVIPSDPAVQGLHTAETRNLNNPDLPSPYPPGAQLFFRAVTSVHESVFAFKLAFLLCDFGIALVLIDILQRRGLGEHLVLAYSWNPLLAIEVAGSGHIDIFGALLLVVSVAVLARGWRTFATLMLGLAVAVKFLPIVLLPLYWKRVRIRDVALAAVVVGFLYVPFLNHGRIPSGSLDVYVQAFRFNGPIFAALARVASPKLLAGLAVVVGLTTATWLRRVAPEGSPELFAWPMAVSLLFAPVVFPWYLLWLLPFLTSTSTALITLWSVSIIPTYVQWHLRALGHPWGALPRWVMLVEYGCLAIAGAAIGLSRITRSDAPRCSQHRAE